MALHRFITSNIGTGVPRTVTRVKIGKHADWEPFDSDEDFIYLRRKGVERAVRRSDEGKVWILVEVKRETNKKFGWWTRPAYTKDIWAQQFQKDLDEVILKEAVNMQAKNIKIQLDGLKMVPAQEAVVEAVELEELMEKLEEDDF